MTLDKDETEVLDATTEEEVEEQEPVEQDQEGQEDAPEGGGPGDEAEPEAEADEVVVTLGDEPAQEEEPPEAAAKWVRELRERHRETTKRNRELEKQLEALKAVPAEKSVSLGEKPTLEACEYDAEVFEQKLEQWHEQKRQVAEQERKKQEEGAKAQAEWQATLNTYNKRKSEFKVSDFEETEASAIEILGETKACMVVDAADNPEVVIYALGKNHKRAKELAAIANPVKFGMALAKLEKDMKVTPKRTAPLPESTVRSNARVSAGVDSTLERLRADADRTGDRTKVAAYMRQQQAKKRA